MYLLTYLLRHEYCKQRYSKYPDQTVRPTVHEQWRVLISGHRNDEGILNTKLLQCS